MENVLRKVHFNLNDQNFTLGDLDYEDPTGKLEEREGYLHCWGKVDYYDSEEGRFKQRTIGVIEECGTGMVYEVASKCVKFDDPLC